MENISGYWKKDNEFTEGTYFTDLEKAVISTAIFYPNVIASIRGELSVTAFSPGNVRLIQCLYQLFDKNDKITPATITAALDQKDLTGDVKRIIENYAIYKDQTNFKDYALKIQVQHQKRQLKILLSEALQNIDSASSADGFAMILEEKMRDITTEQIETGIKTLSESAMEAINEGIERRSKPGNTTGYKDLDYLVGGFLGGALWYVSARSGTGKTTLTLDILRRVASSGVPVAFFSLEMYAKRIGGKIVAGSSGVSRRDLLTGKFDEKQDSILQAVRDVENMEFYIVDGTYSLSGIEEKIGVMSKKHGVKVVAIDYLGLIDHKYDDEMNDITRALKLIAKRYSVDIMLLVQMVKLDKTTRPTVKHLRYIDIQDADVVLLAYEDVYDDVIPEKIDDGVYNVVWDIAKNRDLGVLEVVKRVYDNKRDKYFNNKAEYSGAAKDEIPEIYDPVIKGQRIDLTVNENDLF